MPVFFVKKWVYFVVSSHEHRISTSPMKRYNDKIAVSYMRAASCSLSFAFQFHLKPVKRSRQTATNSADNMHLRRFTRFYSAETSEVNAVESIERNLRFCGAQ